VDWAKPGQDRWNYQRKRIAHSFSNKGAETVASLEKSNRKFRELLDLLDREFIDTRITKGQTESHDIAWSKLFQSIRRHASSLHSALKNGWKCNCMVPHVGALELQERNGGESSACFTMTFIPSRSTKTSASVRRVVIAVQNVQESQIPEKTGPQSTLVQNWYLDKLIQNIEFEPLQETNKLSNLSSNSLPSSSISSKYVFSKSSAKTDFPVNISSIQCGKGTEVLVEESHRK
jgi:hypothetical protein